MQECCRLRTGRHCVWSPDCDSKPGEFGEGGIRALRMSFSAICAASNLSDRGVRGRGRFCRPYPLSAPRRPWRAEGPLLGHERIGSVMENCPSVGTGIVDVFRIEHGVENAHIRMERHLGGRGSSYIRDEGIGTLSTSIFTMSACFCPPRTATGFSGEILVVRLCAKTISISAI